MSKVVEEFLAEVKEQKIKQLLGISLDKKYWSSVIGTDDVEVLRKELSTEQEKMIKNRNGTVHKDDRDMDKINKLNGDINNLEKAGTELVRLAEMEKGIKLYMAFVDKPSKEAVEELENVAKM